MKFPEKVSKKVDLIVKQNEEQKQKVKEAVAAARKRVEDSEKLKQSMMPELLGYAKEVSDWLKEFHSSDDLKKLFVALDLFSDIRIFCDSFWQGFPKPKYSYCYATIVVNKNGKVSYCERYKGMPCHETPLGKIPLHPQVLVAKLHPYYLKNLAYHLKTGDVWDFIDKEVSLHIRS